MKKLNLIWMILLCFLLTACGSEFAKREYNSDEKISQKADRYAKEISVGNFTDQEYSLTISKFNGRETIWNETFAENQNMEIDLSFCLSKGQAKIVHIDNDNHVTTLLECSPETSTDGFITKTVSLQKGQNRLKIVGYDCEDIDLKIQY
ncbi:hypothetical protein E5329_02760 [Petralouisia muris]|uniref:Uncharacterized protein n=1 Tax=Petralouisia muris TaxID=3032872 RepID=A0AC61S0C9_9FIRM|nr:hypothetical protein [Petralouisia muris]TGY97794.1 hypothetical protein E5329_02760 [Petralouisia muris]